MSIEFMIGRMDWLFATGMRISELCTLKVTQVDLVSHKLLIYGKGANERMIQIENEDVVLILAQYYSAFKTVIESTGWFSVNRLNNQLSDQSVRAMM